MEACRDRASSIGVLVPFSASWVSAVCRSWCRVHPVGRPAAAARGVVAREAVSRQTLVAEPQAYHLRAEAVAVTE